MTPQPAAPNKPKIGLALSGGGFRASIFHLGVIRRLEELGIMKDVAVVSTVSGGSIIGAFYLCEMERRLRYIPSARQHDAAIRVELSELIADDFLKAVDGNLRTRALVFTPFYHPWLFVKTLVLRAFRAGARAELIQTEYDKWFYQGNTLDGLPAVTPERAGDESVLYGPKLVLNTTSLLSGERVAFSREPVCGMAEMSKVDKNVLLLSRIVGASSGVPVLFPPTSIAGDLLVDGGVCDNQGIEALVRDPTLDECEARKSDGCDFVIVSDASGQMEQLDSMNTNELKVYSRTNDILMHQVRKKVLQLLVNAHKAKWVEFAFVHLFLNLKDRPQVTHRVSSEFIPAIARLRTDLDQFSFIEREALMYHGYTLIDAQLRRHCQGFLASRGNPENSAPLVEAPLFRDDVQRSQPARNAIKNDLLAGKQGIYLLRSFQKYGWWPVGAIWAFFELVGIGALALVLHFTTQPLVGFRRWVEDSIVGLIPFSAQRWIDVVLEKRLGMPGIGTTIHDIAGLLSILVLVAISLYLATFPAYELVRHLTLELDRRVYRNHTGDEPGARWGKAAPPAGN